MTRETLSSRSQRESIWSNLKYDPSAYRPDSLHLPTVPEHLKGKARMSPVLKTRAIVVPFARLVMLGLLITFAAWAYTAVYDGNTDRPILSVPKGYTNTTSEGQRFARDQVKKGLTPVYAVFGLYDGWTRRHYQALGVSARPFGCVTGGAGTEFWRGNNAALETKFPYLRPQKISPVLSRVERTVIALNQHRHQTT